VSGASRAGYAAAAVTVVIWAAYPVVTRAGLLSDVAPAELVAMRFGIGALMFAPYLALRWRDFAPELWRRGIGLAACQGAGMAALAIFGLQFAPASHNAALGPGASPAWVALLGLLVYASRPGARHALGAAISFAGAIALVAAGTTRWSPGVLVGDCMFVAASALGALYVVQLRRSGTDPWQGAAVVTLYSALVVVPWFLATGGGASFAALATPGLAWQALWQGVLIGFVSLVTMSLAIDRLGSERASAAFATVPPLSAAIAYLCLGEVPSRVELAAILAISSGAMIATLRAPFGASRAPARAA